MYNLRKNIKGFIIALLFISTIVSIFYFIEKCSFNTLLFILGSFHMSAIFLAIKLTNKN